jgi:hypothetical protein
MPFVEHFADWQLKGVGALELLGAIGVVLPVALRSFPADAARGGQPRADPAWRRGHQCALQDTGKLPVNAILLALAVFVAIERFGPQPL